MDALPTRRTGPRRSLGGWATVAVMFSAGCLLTTSLDGLEGPPQASDAGADAGAPDAVGPEAATNDGEGGTNAEAAADTATDAEGDRGGGTDANGDGLEDAMGIDGIADSTDGRPIGPILVARTGDVRGLAEHGSDLYWVQSDPNGGIVRAPKVSGSPVFFHMTANAIDVAVDDAYVYWSSQTAEVFRKPVGSTAPTGELLYVGAREALYLALGTAGRVYATGFNLVVVGPVDAGKSWIQYVDQGGAAGIASSGTDLFWSVNSGIVRGNEAGEPARPVFSAAPGEVLGVATDGQEVFFRAADGAIRAISITSPVPPPPREVCRASIDIGDADVDARPDGPSAPSIADLAVDDAWVYFAEPALHQISKCRKQ